MLNTFVNESTSVSLSDCKMSYSYASYYPELKNTDSIGSVCLTFRNKNDKATYFSFYFNDDDDLASIVENLTRVIDECQAIRVKISNEQVKI